MSSVPPSDSEFTHESGPEPDALALESAFDDDATLIESSEAAQATQAMPIDAQGSTVHTALFEAEQERYTRIKVVGEGAMGEVVLAKDFYLKRKVALKQIHSKIAARRQILSRFLNEAQITAQLDHPSIIPVYNLEVNDGGGIAYSMKLIKGKTFKDLILEARAQYQQGQVDTEHARNSFISHFLKVCDAMAFSHSKDIIHRDLKPANIMVGPFNEVYVMDWGIARPIRGKEEILDEETASLIQSDPDEPPEERTQLGQILGTPRYMSPQQAAGKNDVLDGATDQFSLGVILFELLTLKPAFTAKTPVDLLKRILKAEKEPLTHFQASEKIPQDLAYIIHKATAKKVPDRYPSVQAMADDIRRYQRGEETRAYPDNSTRKLMRWMRNHPRASVIMAMVILSLSATAVSWSLYARQQTLAALQLREERLSPFLTQVAQRSQQLDSHFLKFEALLERLAVSATEALVRGPESSAQLYMNADFQNKRVPTQKYAQIYGTDISLKDPVFKVAPGAPAPVATLRRLHTLNESFYNLFYQSARQLKSQLNPEAFEARMFNQGAPLIWSHVGLANGVMMSYPGNGAFDENFDPRTRPWYRSAQQGPGAVWGQPYLDAQGQGLLVPCSRAIYDYSNQYLGVVGLELTLKYIQKNMISLKQSSVKQVSLLNAEGQIVLQWDPLSQSPQPQEDNAFPGFPQAAVVAAVLKQESGYIEDIKKHRLWAYYRLNTLGWYYVVESDTSLLFSGSDT